MKNTNSIHVTFSLPKDLNVQLHSVVEKRALNKFVAQAIKKALEEEKSLKAAYAAAQQDEDRKKTIADWSSLDLEGWDE